jgi:8-oxo-dGTP diphosphatase
MNSPVLEYLSFMTEQKSILVTAGIVVEGDRVLICQRHHSDAYGMQWEFPGGKVRQGEDLKACLRRELAEELMIEAEIGEEVFRVRHRYPDREVEVAFFAVRSFRGPVRNQVFEAVEWVDRARLTEFDFLEADRELVLRISNAEIV